MYTKERANRRLYVASLSDDIPNLLAGGLIPKRTIYTAPTESQTAKTSWYLKPVFLLTFSVLLFAVSIGTAGYSAFKGQTSVAAPIISIESDIIYEPESFNYGIELALGEEDIFLATRASLISEGVSFIELNLVDMKSNYYENGEVVDTVDILTKGEEGSWWQVPAGLYKVDQKKEKRYSSFGNIYMPWSISFEGNFYINGIPYYPDKENVPEEYVGGGIRMSDWDAEHMFDRAEVGMPVLVHETNFKNDGFLYEAKVPGIHANQYIVADVESSTVIAASDIDAVAPIASLTKLMTALVAAEHIDLEKNVVIANKTSTLVSTLIPRLENNYSASMYSLLQLLLMESSNEAAEIIASEIGRSRFIELMNEKAVSLKMVGTTFTDPSGLDDGNVSSTGDLLRLVQYIYHNRGFILELTSNQHLPTAYTNGQFGQLANFNQIENVGFISGKVGETDAAGQTSISLHSMQIHGSERTVEIILLGTDERTNDVLRLHEYVDEQFN